VDESVGYFGHYRGDLTSPKILVLADPQGYDDLLTSRALTGRRGQYLQGLMNVLGVGEHYLVVKTVPAAMENVSPDDWNWVLSHLDSYLDGLISAVGKSFPEAVWIGDGIWAQRELERRGVDFVRLPRTEEYSRDMESAQKDLFKRLGSEFGSEFGNSHKLLEVSASPIPRSHLPFFARFWEGTSGDRVVPCLGEARFHHFLVSVPGWVSLRRNREAGEFWKKAYDALGVTVKVKTPP